MFGVVGQVMDNATPILKHNLDQGLRQLLRKMVECVQDQVQNQGLVQVRITQYGEIILNELEIPSTKPWHSEKECFRICFV